MRIHAITLALFALSACGPGITSDPNESFVDAFLNKHLTKPQGSTSEGPPQVVIDSVRNCARPSLLVAAKNISDADKAKILNNIITSYEDFADSPEPTPEDVALSRTVNSIIAGCLGASMMQEQMSKGSEGQ